MTLYAEQIALLRREPVGIEQLENAASGLYIGAGHFTIIIVSIVAEIVIFLVSSTVMVTSDNILLNVIEFRPSKTSCTILHCFGRVLRCSMYTD